MESALARLALRLCSVAEGMDEKADGVLAEIRVLIENGASETALDRASSQFVQILATHAGTEDRDAARLSHLAHDLSGLDSLVSTLPVRSDEQERMSSLLHRARSNSSFAERQRALSEFIAMATDALREVGRRYLDADSDGDGPGALDAERHLRVIQKLLLQLVEHLDSLHGNALRSHALRERMQHIRQFSQMEHFAVEMTGELESIDERVRGERRRIADFLGDLRDRLDACEQELRQVHAQNDSGSSGEDHLALLRDRLETLRNDAGALRNELRNKTDVKLKDPLTGVYSRDGFDERCTELMDRWKQTGLGFSLVAVEIPDLKALVRERGHAAGDRILVRVADLLQSRVRGGDVVCRYDNERFVILLPATAIDGAESFAISVQEDLAQRSFEDRGEVLQLRTVCGVTGVVVGDTIDSVVGRAGEALYEAHKDDTSDVVMVA